MRNFENMHIVQELMPIKRPLTNKERVQTILTTLKNPYYELDDRSSHCFSKIVLIGGKYKKIGLSQED